MDNYLTRASDYGDVTSYWQGVELTVNARTNNGLTLQGGVTTGAGTRDNCEITSKVPELLIVLGVQQAISSCHVEEPWLPAWRGLVNYTVPKVDVQLSAIMRSQPNLAATNDPASNGASVAGNLIVANGLVAPALGRPLAGNAANVTLNVALPGDVYPERLNTVDMRVSKILRFGRTRSNVGIDLYNMFNANTGTVFNGTFGTLSTAAHQRPHVAAADVDPQRAVRALQRDGRLLGPDWLRQSGRAGGAVKAGRSEGAGGSHRRPFRFRLVLAGARFGRELEATRVAPARLPAVDLDGLVGHYPLARVPSGGFAGVDGVQRGLKIHSFARSSRALMPHSS